jgi:hypothetical protein
MLIYLRREDESLFFGDEELKIVKVYPYYAIITYRGQQTTLRRGSMFHLDKEEGITINYSKKHRDGRISIQIISPIPVTKGEIYGKVS